LYVLTAAMPIFADKTKEKQLLEGLLIGKDNYMSSSKPKGQKELFDYN